MLYNVALIVESVGKMKKYDLSSEAVLSCGFIGLHKMVLAFPRVDETS